MTTPLIERVQKAYFHHYTGGGNGLSYQACRFCGHPCFRNAESHDDTCWYFRNEGGPCFGLWKYGIRHWICTDCRQAVIAGKKPLTREERRARHDRA